MSAAPEIQSDRISGLPARAQLGAQLQKFNRSATPVFAGALNPLMLCPKLIFHCHESFFFLFQSTVETLGSSFKRKVSKFSKKSQKTSTTSEPPKIEIEEVELEPLENLNVQELPDILVQASSHSSVETQNSAPPVTNQQESLGLTLVLIYIGHSVRKSLKMSHLSSNIKNLNFCAKIQVCQNWNFLLKIRI